MALTDTQRTSIRTYLGWSSRFRDADDRLEDAMDSISLWPTDETKIIALLTACAGIDTRIADAYNRIQAAAVGSINLNQGEIMQLRGEGRRMVKQMAALLAVEIKANAYGGGATGGEVKMG